MKVTRYAFEIEATCPSVPLKELFKKLKSNSGKPNNSKKPERRIYVDTTTNPDYYLGLVVTVKKPKTIL